MAATAGLAAVTAVALRAWLDGVPSVSVEPALARLTADLGPVTAAGFPGAAGIAALAAAVTASAPWLGRRWRRAGHAAVAALVVLRFFTAPLSFDSLEAAVIGWVSGAAVLVLLGGPSRRPSAEAIVEGLAAGGLPLLDLERAGVDARGSTPYFGAGLDGRRYFVKALGADERSADLLFRLYRSVQRHDFGDERPFSSLRRAVEHEAFLALAARDLGVPTPHLRTLARAEPNAYVLAYDAVDGRSLDRLAPEELTAEVLAAIWRQLARLRAARIAHRDLRLANLFRSGDGGLLLIDFGFSEMAASDLLLATDVAELLASSGAVVGADRAAAPALASVDPPLLAAARDRLHPWCLSGASRTALKDRPGLLDDLRARLARG
jgi:undecaprenyl-diphosphatase